jgi:hypothetical protein
MHPVVIAFAVSVPAAFAAGVAFHKYVISEAQAIKAHVTAEVEKVRGEVSGALAKLASKV